MRKWGGGAKGEGVRQLCGGGDARPGLIRHDPPPPPAPDLGSKGSTMEGSGFLEPHTADLASARTWGGELLGEDGGGGRR